MPLDSPLEIAQRAQMVETQMRRRGVRDARVLEAMARVPRHVCVPLEYRGQSYEDHPIPIGEGQTISQPFIVARMLEALALQGDETILEIGTGSGYMTALLSMLGRTVVSLERHDSLANAASATLAQLGCENVTVLVGDGCLGWPERAPYDAIVVSAAAPILPRALFEQLRERGRMVLPVGPEESQELQLIRKLDGRPQITLMEGCRFVPLVSGAPNPHVE